MQLTYHLTRRDIFFANVLYLFTNKVLLFFSIFTIGILTWSLSTGDYLKEKSVGFRIFMIIFSFVFATGAYAAIQVTLHLILVLSRKHVGLIGTHLLEIKDDGLEESTSVNKSLHRWNPSFRVKEFAGYAWIYPTDGKFFHIPKRPGGHDGDLAGFLAQLKAKIGQK